MTEEQIKDRASALSVLLSSTFLIEREMLHIRASTIEECAKVADRIARTYSDGDDAAEREAAEWVALDIRALSNGK